MVRGRKPGIATAKPQKKTRLAQAIEAKAESKPKLEFKQGPFVSVPDYTPEVQEIADSLRHIHSTLHILSTALLAWTQRDTVPTLVPAPVPVEAPNVTPLGEVKPRRGRPAKVKPEQVAVPPALEKSIAEAEEAMAKAEIPPPPPPPEAVPEKPATFEAMRAAAVTLAGKPDGRARLTAILQAEAGVGNLSGVPEEKRAQVIKALTEAANG